MKLVLIRRYKLISKRALLFLLKREYRIIKYFVDIIHSIVVFKITLFEESSRDVSPKRRTLQIKESLCSKILGMADLMLSKRVFLSFK